MVSETDLRLKANPLPYLSGLEDYVGVLARADLFRHPAAGDGELTGRLVAEILDARHRRGSWGKDPTQTGRQLLKLHALGVDRWHEAVNGAIVWAVSRPVPKRAEPAEQTYWGKRWVALEALLRFGVFDHEKVRAAIMHIERHPDIWSEGRSSMRYGLPAALRCLRLHPDTCRSEVLIMGLEILHKNQITQGRSAGAFEDFDQWFTYDTLLMFPNALAQELLWNAVPYIVSQQTRDGPWPAMDASAEEDTLTAVRVLTDLNVLGELLPQAEDTGEKDGP